MSKTKNFAAAGAVTAITITQALASQAAGVEELSSPKNLQNIKNHVFQYCLPAEGLAGQTDCAASIVDATITLRDNLNASLNKRGLSWAPKACDDAIEKATSTENAPKQVYNENVQDAVKICADEIRAVETTHKVRYQPKAVEFLEQMAAHYFAKPSDATVEPAPTGPETIEAMQHARQTARACIENWDAPECHSALTDSARTLSKYYATALSVQGHLLETVKVTENCAAASTIDLTGVESSHLASAFRVCSNAINESYNSTGILPEQSLMQLLVNPEQCLSGDKQICRQLDVGLKPYR